MAAGLFSGVPRWLLGRFGNGPSAPPVANFTASPLSGESPLLVAFTDTSTGSPTSWSWTFGDGGTSTLQNPTHTYTGAGSYSPQLTATNADGSDSLTRTDYITVTQNAPVANFTGTPLTGTVPLAVTFTDSSTNSPTSWAWTFGDYGTSTSQNPSHTYYVAGTYSVALTATNGSGSNTLTRSSYVVVSNPVGHTCDWDSPAASTGDWSPPDAATGDWTPPNPNC